MVEPALLLRGDERLFKKRMLTNLAMIVVSQGPLLHKKEIDLGWPVPVIHSAWSGQGENIVINIPPEDPGVINLNMQKVSTLGGLMRAKELGHDFAVKVRSDFIPFNPRRLLASFCRDKLNFLFWHTWQGGYLVDYLMAGSVEDLIKLWEGTDEKNKEFPERAITNSLTENFGKHKAHFVGRALDGDCDLKWTKRDRMISTYNQNKDFVCEI